MEYDKIIAVDFDGTLCESKWPEIGEPNEEVINYVKEQKEAGAKIILWTCRNEQQTKEAVEWCRKHGIIFDAVNENLPEIVQTFGNDVRKIFANEYIDDKMCTKFEFPFVSTNTHKIDLEEILETFAIDIAEQIGNKI